MNNQTVAIAGGALVVGILLSVAITDSRVNSKVEAALDRAGEASTAAVSDATESMAARIAELEASLSAATAAADATLEERLAALQQEFSAGFDTVSQAASAQAEEFQAALDALIAAPAEAPAEAPVAAQRDMLSEMLTSDVLGVGQTALFAEGSVRAFVTGIDRDAGTASLSVNGAATRLGLGATAAVVPLDCVVAVVSVTAEGVVVGSDCGAPSPANIPPAPETGYTPGNVAIFAEGALRVFVSGLAADGSTARIAINGLDTQSVASGTSVEVTQGDQTCSVTVTGVGNGLVGLDGTCG